MKNNSNRIIKKGIVVSTLFLASLLIVYLVFTSIYTESNQPYKELSTSELIKNFDSNSLNEYIEKSIDVEGTIKEIKNKNDILTIYLSDENTDTYIMCQLQENQNTLAGQLKNGQKVKINGVLKGHLRDVILLNCIIRN
ncbi:MAG: OB-fold protein [bacterium]